MAKPTNKSYFPLAKLLGEHKKLNRKQLSAVKRALAKNGRKLPKGGWCSNLTKVGGKFLPRYTYDPNISRVEICHEIIGGKHEYWMRSRPARERRR